MEAYIFTITKKACQNQSDAKSMLFFYYYYEGLVHHDYAPKGQTINEEYYLQVMKRLCDARIRKWPQLWASGGWLLRHNNTLAHTLNLVQQYLGPVLPNKLISD